MSNYPTQAPAPGFEQAPRKEEDMTVGELKDLMRECREWSHGIDDIRGYTQTGRPSRDYSPSQVAAAKGLYELDYFLQRDIIASYFVRIHEAPTRATPEKSAEMIIAGLHELIKNSRDELYKDVRPLNNKLTQIGMSPTSPLRPTHFPESSADCMAKNSDAPTSSQTVVTSSQSPAAERRARQVKQTLDDFELLLLDEVVLHSRLEQWTKSNSKSPIAIAFCHNPIETLDACKRIQTDCRNDRWAVKVVHLSSKLKEGTIAKDWAHFRKLTGLND